MKTDALARNLLRDILGEDCGTCRDDLGKLPLPAAAKAYARRKGLKSMMNQPKPFQKVNAMLTNPGKVDRFQNYTVGKKDTNFPAGSGSKTKTGFQPESACNNIAPMSMDDRIRLKIARDVMRGRSSEMSIDAAQTVIKTLTGRDPNTLESKE